MNISINNLMSTKQSILKSNLNILLNHSVTKGEHCEGAWIDFFRSFLPSKYAVDKGFVFDSKGNVSEQIDIIIYDALYAPLVFGTESGEKFVTAESVYAVFESKPDINKENIEYANKKIDSVTSLYRSKRDVYVAGERKKAGELTHIIGGILAVNSSSSKSVKEYMDSNEHIGVGCAINKLSFLVKRDKDNKKINFTVSNNEEEILIAFFYIILDELYKLGTVIGMDIRNYADATLKGMKLEREEREIINND